MAKERKNRVKDYIKELFGVGAISAALLLPTAAEAQFPSTPRHQRGPTTSINRQVVQRARLQNFQGTRIYSVHSFVGPYGGYVNATFPFRGGQVFLNYSSFPLYYGGRIAVIGGPPRACPIPVARQLPRERLYEGPEAEEEIPEPKVEVIEPPKLPTEEEKKPEYIPSKPKEPEISKETKKPPYVQPEKPQPTPDVIYLFEDGYRIICKIQYDDEARAYLNVVAKAAKRNNLHAYNTRPDYVGFRDEEKGYEKVLEIKLPKKSKLTEEEFIAYLNGKLLDSRMFTEQDLRRVARVLSNYVCDQK